MAIFSAIASALGLGGAAATGAGAGAAGAATGISGAAGAIGTAATVAGIGLQYAGQVEAQKGADRAEKLREAQANIEETRARRNIVRQSIAARSEALTNATSQGAAQGSGLAGGFGQIQGETGGAATANAQNGQIGGQMFAANRQISRGQTLAATGSGVSSLGGALVKNQNEIGRLGAYVVG